jgi:hypothetical protein
MNNEEITKKNVVAVAVDAAAVGWYNHKGVVRQSHNPASHVSGNGIVPFARFTFGGKISLFVTSIFVFSAAKQEFIKL